MFTGVHPHPGGFGTGCGMGVCLRASALRRASRRLGGPGPSHSEEQRVKQTSACSTPTRDDEAER